MDPDENIKKNIKFLEDLSKDGITLDLKICPRCKSAAIKIMDVVGMYSPLSPARYVCKKCGWMGRTPIEMTNRRIDELDEAMLEDIIAIMSEDENEKK
jgi:ribosomal protein S27AE